jgi:succinate dehydrogenase/fumarate reductase flavoprotein subunit
MTRPSLHYKATMRMNGLIDTRAIKTIHTESLHAADQVKMSGALMRFQVMFDMAAEFQRPIEEPKHFVALGSRDPLGNSHASVKPLPGQLFNVDMSGSQRSRVRVEPTGQRLICAKSSNSTSQTGVQ